MAMVVVSDWTMCCMDCGGFHFLADDNRIVTHSDGAMYTKVTGKYPNIKIEPCPNIGKRFRFPEQGPTLAIEVE
jgi:hypothetical protein